MENYCNVYIHCVPSATNLKTSSTYFSLGLVNIFKYIKQFVKPSKA